MSRTRNAIAFKINISDLVNGLTLDENVFIENQGRTQEKILKGVLEKIK